MANHRVQQDAAGNRCEPDYGARSLILNASADTRSAADPLDGADASRRVIVLRIPIRFLSGASRLAIKRLQRTAVPASKLACPSAADPQHVLLPISKKWQIFISYGIIPFNNMKS